MKTFEVLEAHQGDKFYLPGDPETGTRIADENEVSHLVSLGLLKEIGDAPDASAVVDTEAASVEDLQAQIAALTQERDEARQDLETLQNDAQAGQQNLYTELELVRAERDTAVAERDTAVADLEKAQTASKQTRGSRGGN